MRKVLTPTLLLAIAGVGVWAFWPRSETGGARLTAAIVRPAKAAMAKPAIASRRVVEFLIPTRPMKSAGVPAAALAPEDEALLAETIALQRLAADTDLELNAHQWSSFAAVTQEIQAVRQAYEASIAIATPGAGRTRVDIPAYPAAGDALRAKLHEKLHEQLGDANAEEILARLGSRLEGYFGGFGVSVQSLDIAADGTITRTMNYWNSVEGRGKLTARHETHFAAEEDPTGELWRPFLALAARM